MIAYSSNQTGNDDIWVQSIGGGRPVQVTSNTAGDRHPSWSPDGQRLVFESDREGGGLFLVPPLGGEERRLTTFGHRPQWSPDGSQVLFSGSALRDVNEPQALYLVAREGGTPRRVLEEASRSAPRMLFGWHPDGRVSILARPVNRPWTFGTYSLTGAPTVISTIATGTASKLQELGLDLNQFTWAPDGGALYLEGTAGGASNVWRIPVDSNSLSWTGSPERLTTGPGLDGAVAVSRDGHRIAFTTRNEQIRVWSFPLPPLDGKMLGQPEPVTPSGVNVAFPDISTDGRYLVYRADAGPRQQLLVKPVGTEGQGRVLVEGEPGEQLYMPRWSPDGTQVAYFRRSAKSSRMFVRELTGGSERPITSVGVEAWPSDWSRDARAILAGGGEFGAVRLVELQLSDAPTAESHFRVVAERTDFNLWQGRYSPDGAWVAFAAAPASQAGTNRIYVTKARGGNEWTPVTDEDAFADKPRWSPDGKTLFFVSSRGGPLNVWGRRFDRTAGSPSGPGFQVTDMGRTGPLIFPSVALMELMLSEDHLFLPMSEVVGHVWLLEERRR
jgi:Tol biopolymer transport system component